MCVVADLTTETGRDTLRNALEFAVSGALEWQISEYASITLILDTVCKTCSPPPPPPQAGSVVVRVAVILATPPSSPLARCLQALLLSRSAQTWEAVRAILEEGAELDGCYSDFGDVMEGAEVHDIIAAHVMFAQRVLKLKEGENALLCNGRVGTYIHV